MRWFTVMISLSMTPARKSESMRGPAGYTRVRTGTRDDGQAGASPVPGQDGRQAVTIRVTVCAALSRFAAELTNFVWRGPAFARHRTRIVAVLEYADAPV